MWLWVMALVCGLWRRGGRARAGMGAMIGPWPLSFCHGFLWCAVRKGDIVWDRDFRRSEAWSLRLSKQTGRMATVPAQRHEASGGGLRDRSGNVLRMRGMAGADFEYFCQDETAGPGPGPGRCDADGAAFAARGGASGAGLCALAGTGGWVCELARAGGRASGWASDEAGGWVRAWARGDQSAQSGLRF